MARPKNKTEVLNIEKLDKSEMDDLAQLALAASKNLVDFRRLMLDVDVSRERGSADFHYEWSDILLNESNSFAIEGFRESAKDQIVMRAFPLYCLSFPRKDLAYIVLVMANTTLVNKKMKEIQREYLENKLLSSGVIEIVEQSADAFEVKIATGKEQKMSLRVEGYGKGSSIRGLSWKSRRPDVVIMNDVQDTADALSDTVLENDYNWFLDDVVFLGRDSRIFMIGNNLGEKCIIERVRRSNDHFGFSFKRVPIADGTDENSTPSWPAMFPMSYILEERKKYAESGKLSIWTRNRMCECVAEEDRCFRIEDFQYYSYSDAVRIAGMCNVYLRIDPSAGVKEVNDPSAFVVVGINSDNQWMVLDVVNKRLKQSEKIDMVFMLAQKWHLANCGIENSKEGIILMQDIREQMPRRNIFFPVIEVKSGNTKKSIRIEAMEPRFKSKSVWFPDQAEWRPELEQQLLMFSRSGNMTLHDDVIDALAYTMQGTHAPVNMPGDMSRNSPQRDLPRYGSMTVSFK